MASHYVFSSSFEFAKLYKNYSSTSQVIAILSNNTQITVLSEYEGPNCQYHYVQTESGVEGYILNNSILPLPDTVESAPYTCNIPSPNSSYTEPEWQNLTELDPYINDKTNEYCVCITSDSLTPNSVNESDILKQGIKALFKFFNKPYDDSTIEKYMSYYIFATIKDVHVPIRPLMRTKYLITVPVKYFNVIEDDSTSQSKIPFDNDLSLASTVVKFDLKLSKKLFDSLNRVVGLYQNDLMSAGSYLSFSTSDYFGNSNGSFEISELDFTEKNNGIKKFKKQLDNLLALNKINPVLPISSPKEIILEFYINDDCKQVYDVAAVVNKKRTFLRVGIEKFLTSEPVTDQTVVNFIKNINTISRLEKCKNPWYSFSETYVYPKTEARQITIDASDTKFEQNKKINKIFYSIQQRSSQNPIKTSAQIKVDQDAGKLIETNTQFFSDSNGPLQKSIYQGDPDFDPNNLQTIIDKLETSFNETPISQIAKSLNAIERNGEFYEVLSVVKNPSLSVATGQIGNVLPLPKSVFQLDAEAPRITILENGIETEVSLYFSPKDLQIDKLVDELKDAVFEKLKQIMQEYLEKIGIDKLLDLLKSIMLSISKALEIKLDFSLDLGAIGSFNYDEILNDLLPYLSTIDQILLYKNMLLNLGSINKDSFTNLLKQYLNVGDISITDFDLSQIDLNQIQFENVELQGIDVNLIDLNNFTLTQNDVNKILDALPYELIVSEVAKRMVLEIAR